ncbi:MAG: GvpL/GvpF family gas vesicle protein [Planctomycetes bacterium]|nr:GvpL/GvpF family gas vesicle protein [Planctomycetota bacterium]MBI3844843.1 GvpL/GvpF family gas vesicle protein [Planctomycetota bacterium]
MKSLCLYALTADEPRRLPSHGVSGERLRVMAVRDAFAVVGEVDAIPSLDVRALRRHDAVVRRVAGAAEAVLPVRFGSIAADRAWLESFLEARWSILSEAFDLVRGREQMTLRVFETAASRRAPSRMIASTESAAEACSGGPGLRHLRARAREHARSQSVPEIDGVRPALASLVRAELTERHDAWPFVASVFHLIERGNASKYSRVVASVAAANRGVRLHASGPRPPYAFAPKLVS